MDLGFQEILFIVVIALLVYGGELPGVMRSLGRTVGSIKRALQEGTKDVTQKLDIGIDPSPRLGIDVSPEEDLPRLVRRAPELAIDAPAPHDVATEDVSGAPLRADTDASRGGAAAADTPSAADEVTPAADPAATPQAAHPGTGA